MDKEKLKSKLTEFKEIEKKLSDTNVINNQKLYRELSQKYSEMKPLIENIRILFKYDKEIEENKEIIESTEDKEIKQMAEEEINTMEEKRKELLEKIKIQLIPPDPDDNKDIIFEIRQGTGGEEAALFVADLYRMYKKYAENKGYKIEIMDFHNTELGGFKEIIFAIKGNNAYKLFKYESGTHRVQRVPETESSGRIHTSAVTVAVLPEVEDVEVEINEKDLKIDVFHSSGAGGQNVNKVATAIRITHLPTKTVVTCQDERSQHKNREKAMRILKARLYEKKMKELQSKVSSDRKSQVGTGDRSAKIRTYNFPERRVTDHRINLTLYKLETILNGDLDLIIQSLIEEDQKKKSEDNLN